MFHGIHELPPNAITRDQQTQLNGTVQLLYFRCVCPEQWKKNVEHVRKKVEDHLRDNFIKQFTISVKGESDESTDEEEEDSSECSISDSE